MQCCNQCYFVSGDTWTATTSHLQHDYLSLCCNVTCHSNKPRLPQESNNNIIKQGSVTAPTATEAKLHRHSISHVADGHYATHHTGIGRPISQSHGTTAPVDRRFLHITMIWYYHSCNSISIFNSIIFNIDYIIVQT